MSDLPKTNKAKLLKRIVSALTLNGNFGWQYQVRQFALEIPLSLESVKAILTTRLENDDEFDTKKVLADIDHKLKFQPDIHIFNCLFWQLAKTGKLEEFKYL